MCPEDGDLQDEESCPTGIPSSLIIEGPARVQAASFPLSSASPALQTEADLSDCDISLVCLLSQQIPPNFCTLVPGPYGAFVQIRERYLLLWAGAAPGQGSRLWSRRRFLPAALGLVAARPTYLPAFLSGLEEATNWMRGRLGFNLSETIVFCLFSENSSIAGSTSPSQFRDQHLASQA